MNEWDTGRLMAADKKYIWHPFTPMHEWCAAEHEPLVLVEGRGAILRDSRGREYIDGNSSIWTNIHGHNHPAINTAIKEQLERVAHTSFLGFTNPPAIELAAKLVSLFPESTLSRVFYSDDGSTGIEAALRISAQYWRLRGEKRDQFIVFEDAYHGDTAGAAALGATTLFRSGVDGWSFPITRVSNLNELKTLPTELTEKSAAVIIEPLVRGAAGLKLWPDGTLQGVRAWCDRFGVLFIADEVLTGFGRTGTMFACEKERVIPDMLVLAKALTGGYLPLAITLISEQIFSRFYQTKSREGTLFYGHSYTGNALACAAALASLKIFESENVLASLQPKIALLRELLAEMADWRCVHEIRQCGFMAGIEVRWDGAERLAERICMAARKHGLLTRPIRDVIVLMPPFCISADQLKQTVAALSAATKEVCPEASLS